MMERCCCLICNSHFNTIFDIKKHLSSGKHQGRKRQIFKKDILKAPGLLPYIIVFRLIKDRLFVGLSMLTFCCSVEENISFYLCHVCGEKCPSNSIITHVFSGSHYSNYLNYTDPDSLNFAWTPSVDAPKRIICTSMRKKIFPNGSGQLQVLDLPADLLKSLERKIYSEVMQCLSKNEELLMQMKGSIPKRVTIQTYLKDSQRKYPLLGLQHLIECVCTGNPTKAYYLCTLCKLSLPSLMIIKHVLSFDHIHTYFKVLHPSTLLSKECYQDCSKTFSSEMLSLAKQSAEINAAVNTDMKQVTMGPDAFASVNFASYAEALTHITCDGKKNSLVPVIKPGKRLEFRYAPPATSESSAAYPASVDSAMPKTPAASVDSTRPAAAGPSAVRPAPAKPPASAEPRAPETPTAAAESALSHDIRCQNCSTIFNTTWDYCKHLETTGHKKMLDKYFKVQGATNGPKPKDWTQRIGLFLHLKEGLKTNTPVVGVPLIVSCISTEAEVKPVYLCFACKDCFSENRLTQHFNSTKHLIHVLLYHNPWRLPFAWENELDVTHLRLMAAEAEKEVGPDLMLVKMLDVPYRMFFKFCHSFEKVMRVLQLHHTLLMHSVPRRETYRKLNNLDRFPLLGQEFLVRYHMSELQYEDTNVLFLCLLCKRTLSNEESYAHLFSREHITSFLENFHPGTLDSDTASELLDLARQAARIHPVSHLQVIRGEWPTGKPHTYQNAKLVLMTLKHKEGRGHLLPQIVPRGKLVPRTSAKHRDQKLCGTSSRNGLELQTCEKDLHRSDVGNVRKRPSEETPASSENDSKNGKGLISQSCSEQIKTECTDTLQSIKEEKTEASLNQEPAGTAFESFPNDAHDIKVEAEVEGIGAGGESWVNPVGTTHRVSPGKGGTTVKSAEETCSDGIKEEMYQTEQHFNLKQEPSCEALLTLPSIENENNADKAIGTGPSQETLTDTGMTEPEGQAQQKISPEPEPVSAVESMDILEVEDMEIEEDTEVQHSSVAEENESTSSSADFPTKIQVPASSCDTHLSLFRSNKGQLKPIDLANSSRVHHDSRGNSSNANLIQTPTAAPKAACQMAGTCHRENSASCDAAASTKSAVAKPSVRFRSPSPSKQAAKSKELSKLAATTTKRPATSSDSSRHCKMSKSSESEGVSHTWRLASLEYGRTEASTGLSKNSVQTNTDVSPECTPEAPHSTSQLSVRSKQKHPAYQPSCDSASKRTKRAPNIGLNQLIVVSCQSKRQVYCKLCSVKLNFSGHVSEYGHKQNYVKKFFGITDKLLPDVLDKVVSSLSKVERELGSRTCQEINVSMDTYKELQDLPVNKALEILKEMLAHKDSKVCPTATQISPVRLLDPDDEMEPALKGDASDSAHQTDRVTVTKRSETVENAGRLSSCPTSSRSDDIGPDLQVKEILARSAATSLGKVSSLDLLPSTSGTVEQQNHQRAELPSKPVPKSSVENAGVSVAKSDLSRISIGERIHSPSNLSTLLMVEQTPIVGLSSIWECRGISSNQLPSFYLCESCVEKLSIELICKHMNSASHQLAYLTEHYPRDMLFWGEKDLSHMEKLSALKDVVSLLSKHEAYAKMDAQVVLLRGDLYKCIQAAPVSEALKLVQSVTRGPNLELSRALHEYVESKQAEKHVMDEDKQGRMLSTPPTPQDTVRKISLESEANVCLRQRSVPESPSSSVSPHKSVTPKPADESQEPLIAPRSMKAQLDASVSQSATQPGTGSAFEPKQSSHASASNLLLSNNKDGSQTQGVFNDHQAECINLISLIRNLKHADGNTSSLKSAEISCLQPPSQMNVRRWNSEGRTVAVAPVLPSAPSVAPTGEQLVGHAAPSEDSVPYSGSPNDTSEKQPGGSVLSESTDKNQSQVTSSLGVEGNKISVQISRPRSVAETDGTAVRQRPLNYDELIEGRQLARCLSAAASGHYGWCNQTVTDAHGQLASSAEAVNATPESNTSGGFHRNQIIAGFGCLGGQVPPGGVGLDVQQQMQHILQLLRQQQVQQQQFQCQMQQQMHQFQLQQPQMYQVHQYQMYQQQQSREVQQQQQPQMQPLIHQYQIYPHQMPQQIHANNVHLQSNQDQVQYVQYCTGTTGMAPNQSHLPVPAQANVEYNIHRIPPAQHDNLVMPIVSPSGGVEHAQALHPPPGIPAVSHVPFCDDNQHRL